jgi:hypothetical protein
MLYKPKINPPTLSQEKIGAFLMANEEVVNSDINLGRFGLIAHTDLFNANPEFCYHIDLVTAPSAAEPIKSFLEENNKYLLWLGRRIKEYGYQALFADSVGTVDDSEAEPFGRQIRIYHLLLVDWLNIFSTNPDIQRISAPLTVVHGSYETLDQRVIIDPKSRDMQAAMREFEINRLSRTVHSLPFRLGNCEFISLQLSSSSH